MRHALVIARRELAEKRFVAVSAAAFAVLPFLLATIPGIRGPNGAADVIATAAGLLAIGFTGGLALVLGGSVIGRDLAENRLSFYFSRPLGAASIWFGKVAAALALIVAAFAIIVAPARVGASSGVQHTWGGQNVLLFALAIVGGSFVLFFVAHVIGSFVRSRSAWIAADFAALCIAAYAGYLVLRPLVDSGADQAAKALIIAIGCGVVIALIGGGAWQLERGRTDRKRSHVALSQFVWAIVGATLLLTGAFVAWMVSASPSDLKTVFAELPRSGSWAIVDGQARHRLDYRAAFLYNFDTGAYSRLSAGRLWRAGFTPDSKSLFIARADTRHGQAEIFRRPVDGGAEVSTGLTVPLQSDYVTNANGDRIASIYGSLLSVYDVPQKQSLGSVRLPGGPNDVVALYFASPTVVRIATFNFFRTTDSESVARSLRLFEFDTTRRALQQTGELKTDAHAVAVGANEEGSRLLVRNYQKGIDVIDGRTAAVQFELPVAGLRSATLLHDGGVAIARRDGAGVAVGIADASGKIIRSIPIGVAVTGPLHELRDGRLLVSTRPPAQASGELATVVIDPAAGTIVQRIPGAALVGNPLATPYNRDPRRGPIDLPRIYRNTQGQLFRWNAVTNTAEVLLPKS